MAFKYIKNSISNGVFNQCLRVWLRLSEQPVTTLIVFALLCTLAAKFYRSVHTDLIGEFPSWVVWDIAVLAGLEAVLILISHLWRKKWVLHSAMLAAAVAATWSVINASWLIRTGTQVLPRVLMPLVRDPLNSLTIVGVNLLEMPLAAALLLVPSGVGIAFLMYSLRQSNVPRVRNAALLGRMSLSVAIVLLACLAGSSIAENRSKNIVSAGLRYNCHVEAFRSLLAEKSSVGDSGMSDEIRREIPLEDKFAIGFKKNVVLNRPNILMVILEGVQYKETSLGGSEDVNTPYLERIAEDGVCFTNMRSSLTHTTKALFSIHTGRYPSVSQDLIETIPRDKPYASLVTVAANQLGYRSAFFQSAKGNFENRPGLVKNVGFDSFWSREYLDDDSGFVGYLGCDEFLMIEPLMEWIEADEGPFIATLMCSVTHDPYEVPQWYDEGFEKIEEPVEKYRRAIEYTDSFLARLDEVLADKGLKNNTILCVVGDHGEAFGEHGLMGHERIAFDEVLRVPWIIRGIGETHRGLKVDFPVSSVDVTPTLLSLIGFEVKPEHFDGLNALGPLTAEREVFFSGWLQQGPAGFVKDELKFVYEPSRNELFVYELGPDNGETVSVSGDYEDLKVGDMIIDWRKSTILPDCEPGEPSSEILYDRWVCGWEKKFGWARYKPAAEEN